MRNEEQSGRKQRGLLSITVGLLLIAAALFLASYNLYDELRAEQAARQVVNKLDIEISFKLRVGFLGFHPRPALVGVVFTP